LSLAAKNAKQKSPNKNTNKKPKKPKATQTIHPSRTYLTSQKETKKIPKLQRHHPNLNKKEDTALKHTLQKLFT
jgi:hypothetical protein